MSQPNGNISLYGSYGMEIIKNKLDGKEHVIYIYTESRHYKLSFPSNDECSKWKELILDNMTIDIQNNILCKINNVSNKTKIIILDSNEINIDKEYYYENLIYSNINFKGKLIYTKYIKINQCFILMSKSNIGYLINIVFCKEIELFGKVVLVLWEVKEITAYIDAKCILYQLNICLNNDSPNIMFTFNKKPFCCLIPIQLPNFIEDEPYIYLSNYDIIAVERKYKKNILCYHYGIYYDNNIVHIMPNDYDKNGITKGKTGVITVTKFNKFIEYNCTGLYYCSKLFKYQNSNKQMYTELMKYVEAKKCIETVKWESVVYACLIGKPYKDNNNDRIVNTAKGVLIDNIESEQKGNNNNNNSNDNINVRLIQSKWIENYQTKVIHWKGGLKPDIGNDFKSIQKRLVIYFCIYIYGNIYLVDMWL